ncbi:hypothetical protein Zmor_015484 [Zophobas morio]|uniref:Peptidase S1 domain-containing protein n=1 Tax=Zophobas morio TaxID=2755281 RepID=A0AA38IKC2_9CUCU|nr:hypothetical protein Zmor_015484 [Zophobas morio]
MKFFGFIVIYVLSASLSSVLSRSTRIIGGTNARAGEFPFAAAVHIHTSDGQYLCGGALVNNQWVLTAAQCCEDALRFTIVLGINNLQDNGPNRLTVAAEEYILAPGYDAFTLQHDIGLIKLRMPIEYTNYIQPILLPTAPVNDYTAVVAIGWGQTSDDEAATVSDLNRVTITTLSNEECRLTYGAAIIDDMVCAEGNYNQGTCNGDSGSPLIQYALNQKATVVAVSSFFSGNGCESTDPSGFTRTYPYVDWIKSVTDIL